MDYQFEEALPPLKKRHERKTFATPTLKIIHSRIQYYYKVLKTDPPEDPKKLQRYEKIKSKYEQSLKVRKLLKNAIKNLYL